MLEWICWHTAFQASPARHQSPSYGTAAALLGPWSHCCAYAGRPGHLKSFILCVNIDWASPTDQVCMGTRDSLVKRQTDSWPPGVEWRSSVNRRRAQCDQWPLGRRRHSESRLCHYTSDCAGLATLKACFLIWKMGILVLSSWGSCKTPDGEAHVEHSARCLAHGAGLKLLLAGWYSG